MRAAIVGAGALGIYIGGMISKAGHDAVLVAGSDKTVNELNANGALIRGALEDVIPVAAVTPENIEGLFDYVFLLTKRMDTRKAMERIIPHLQRDGVVCTLQNGIPEDEVAELAGPARTLGGVVLISAARVSPGATRLTSLLEVVEKSSFLIGETDGRTSDRLLQIQKILASAGGCLVVPNLMSIRWSKLLMNAAFGAMTAALGCSTSDLVQSEQALETGARLADEAVKTAHACGVKLHPLQGVNLEELELRDGETCQDKVRIFGPSFARYPNTKSSMMQDLEKGIKTEVEYINGHISRKGRENGIATPYNDLLIELVNQAEQSKAVPVFEESIRRFQELF